MALRLWKSEGRLTDPARIIWAAEETGNGLPDVGTGHRCHPGARKLRRKPRTACVLESFPSKRLWRLPSPGLLPRKAAATVSLRPRTTTGWRSRGQIYAQAKLGRAFPIHTMRDFLRTKHQHRMTACTTRLPYPKTFGIPIVEFAPMFVRYRHPRGAITIVRFRDL